jgi:hypothetical protein
MADIESFTKLLQLSISPIGLISGAGLLLLSITNRLGRSIDRVRVMATALENGSADKNAERRKQVDILVRRAGLLRNSVFFTGFSIFLSTLMILGVFLRLFLGWKCESVVLVFLFSSVTCLCMAMIYFLLDVSLALKALKLEVDKP